jgi:hypothetical protein
MRKARSGPLRRRLRGEESLYVEQCLQHWQREVQER